jgi:protein-S-isoprenylcysteine O-methyltransferase Ste14
VIGDATTTEGGSAVSAERGPGVTVPPTLAFVAGFALAWWLHQRTPLQWNRYGSDLLTTAGWLALASGTALFLWALHIFFKARTGIMLQKPATNLMMVGPYAWSRNPQYVAFTLIYIGVALVTNTLWPLVLLPSVLLLVASTVIAREERYLRATFGRPYEEYCRQVGRWI